MKTGSHLRIHAMKKVLFPDGALIALFLFSSVGFSAEKRILLSGDAQCLRVVADQDFTSSPPKATNIRIESQKNVSLGKNEIGTSKVVLYLESDKDDSNLCEWGSVSLVSYLSENGRESFLGRNDFCLRKPLGSEVGNPNSKEAKLNEQFGSGVVTVLGPDGEEITITTPVATNPSDLSSPLWVNICYKKIKSNIDGCVYDGARVEGIEIKNFSDDWTSSFSGAQLNAIDLCLKSVE